MTVPPPAPLPTPSPGLRRFADSLAARLFALTLGAILFTEFLIFIPSVSGLRTQWLEERVAAARIAALALDAAPMREVSDELSESLLMKAEVLAVAEVEDEMHIQLLAPQMPIEGPMRLVDLRGSTAMGRSFAALREYLAPEGEILIVVAEGSAEGRVLEIVLPQALAMVVPGSGLIKQQAEKEGLDKLFINAGFEWREPGCSMCLAMNADRLEPGERCASTSNRNFEGRQGKGGRTHLVPPAVAAATAVAGVFATPTDLS